MASSGLRLTLSFVESGRWAAAGEEDVAFDSCAIGSIRRALPVLRIYFCGSHFASSDWCLVRCLERVNSPLPSRSIPVLLPPRNEVLYAGKQDLKGIKTRKGLNIL